MPLLILSEFSAQQRLRDQEAMTQDTFLMNITESVIVASLATGDNYMEEMEA